ncbi:hypothetical protein TH53_00105 [Pedobacter lusitanus]|uniref:Uncharacterized protein n=1 Tax=Pedobacter lusitanus TaxID=1503925 RepID=A0A0D0GX31_9SPHI|nr:hypothetical protein TH53_00105 [Pedobacter lusitanus]
MKKIILYILTFMLNVALYFFLQIIASFVQFGLLGSGVSSNNKTIWVSLSFALLQISLLFLLYKKKILLKDGVILILNVLCVVCLSLYFIVGLFGT